MPGGYFRYMLLVHGARLIISAHLFDGHEREHGQDVVRHRQSQPARPCRILSLLDRYEGTAIDTTNISITTPPTVTCSLPLYDPRRRCNMRV